MAHAAKVIVDLAARTAAPLSRWLQDLDLLTVLPGMGGAVNFRQVSDAGTDSVDLLERQRIKTWLRKSHDAFAMLPLCARKGSVVASDFDQQMPLASV